MVKHLTLDVDAALSMSTMTKEAIGHCVGGGGTLKKKLPPTTEICQLMSVHVLLFQFASGCGATLAIIDHDAIINNVDPNMKPDNATEPQLMANPGLKQMASTCCSACLLHYSTFCDGGNGMLSCIKGNHCPSAGAAGATTPAAGAGGGTAATVAAQGVVESTAAAGGGGGGGGGGGPNPNQLPGATQPAAGGGAVGLTGAATGGGGAPNPNQLPGATQPAAGGGAVALTGPSMVVVNTAPNPAEPPGGTGPAGGGGADIAQP